MKEKCCASCKHLCYKSLPSSNVKCQSWGAFCATSLRFIPQNAVLEFNCNLFEKKKSIDEIKIMAEDIGEC